MPNGVQLKEIISGEAIAERVNALAKEINLEYAGKELTVICVLKGGFLFFSDLIRHLTCFPQLEFVRVVSYGKGTVSKSLTMTKDIELSIADRQVLIVEDIVDTGRSMDFLLKHFASRGAAGIKVAALIDKPERRTYNVHVDFKGFDVPAGFLVGYGLDYAEQYRELPAIYEMMFSEK